MEPGAQTRGCSAGTLEGGERRGEGRLPWIRWLSMPGLAGCPALLSPVTLSLFTEEELAQRGWDSCSGSHSWGAAHQGLFKVIHEDLLSQAGVSNFLAGVLIFIGFLGGQSRGRGSSSS